jgi:hypothetical protein
LQKEKEGGFDLPLFIRWNFTFNEKSTPYSDTVDWKVPSKTFTAYSKNRNNILVYTTENTEIAE